MTSFFLSFFAVCSARIIFESDLMQDFLQLKQAASGGESNPPAKATPPEKQVNLRVLLPDRTVMTISIMEFWRTPEVFEVGMLPW